MLICGCFFFREKLIYLKFGMEEGDGFYIIVFVVVIFFGLWIIKRFYIDEVVGNFYEKYVFFIGCDLGFGREIVLWFDSLGFNVFVICLISEG